MSFYHNCEITIKPENGECVTFTSSYATTYVNCEYEEVTDCCGRVVGKVKVAKGLTLEARLFDMPCDICPPKKPGLLKRIFRKK